MQSLHRSIPFCPPPKLPISAHFAELLRPLPRPNDTYEGWVVYHHKDLEKMSHDQLSAEVIAVEARIAYEGRVHPWFIERLSQVRARLTSAGVAR